jgi:hypothetical protein
MNSEEFEYDIENLNQAVCIYQGYEEFGESQVGDGGTLAEEEIQWTCQQQEHYQPIKGLPLCHKLMYLELDISERMKKRGRVF